MRLKTTRKVIRRQKQGEGRKNQVVTTESTVTIFQTPKPVYTATCFTTMIDWKSEQVCAPSYGQKSMFSKAQKRGSKKKWSIAEFLYMDSKKAPEKHGDVRFAKFLANKICINFLCPK